MRFCEATRELAELAEELEAAEIEDARQARAKIAEIYAEPQHEVKSAIDRQREEERAAEVGPRYQGNTAARMILHALWSLTKTLAGSLSHVILAADRRVQT